MLYIVYSVSVMVLLIETDVLRLNTEPKYLYIYMCWAGLSLKMKSRNGSKTLEKNKQKKITLDRCSDSASPFFFASLTQQQ